MKWYALGQDGQATLCFDEADARETAREADAMYPRNAPYRAVQMGPSNDGWQPIAIEGKTCEQLRRIRDQMAGQIKQINTHLENVANDLMHSRVGSVCTYCNRGKFRIDGNGYQTFLRCGACAHVPALNDDGVDLFAPKPPEEA